MSTLSLFDLEPKEPAKPRPPGDITMRPYQKAAVDGCFEAWADSNSTLVVLPTGCGKTMVFAEIIRRTQGRVMVLAHRQELIFQAAQKIEWVTGEKPEIEMGGFYARRGGDVARVVVSTIQTQMAGKGDGRKADFDPDEFELVVVDEAHHAIADTYRQVIEHYQAGGVNLLGVTATPDRTDEAALGQVFKSIGYVYEVRDAINDGWLVPVRERRAIVEGLDFSSIRTVAGDFNQKQLGELMESKGSLLEVGAATLEHTEGRKSIVFATTVAQAEALCHVFNGHETDCARWVSGKTPDDERRQILADYRDDRFRILCNVGVFTEGFDEPSIGAVVIARPTKSRALYAQMLGRGTRPLDGLVDQYPTAAERRAAIAASEKPDVLVLDFAGNAGNHKLITPADVLGGDYPEEVIERAKELAEQDQHDDGDGDGDAPKRGDVLDRLSEAEKQIKAEQDEERKRLQSVQVKAKVRFEDTDPFDVLDIQPVAERGWDTGPTEKQAAYLAKKGVKAEGLTKRQASQLIDKLIARQNHGWCTYKQAKILSRNGIDPKGVRFEDASRMIDEIFKGRKPKGAAMTTADVVSLDQIDSY